MSSSLIFSFALLLAVAAVIERPLRHFVHPDVRRDLTLADAVRPQDISAWLLANLWRPTRLVAFGIVFAPPLFCCVLFAFWEGADFGDLARWLVLAAIHLALSIPPCAATLLLLAKRACDRRRGLLGGAFIVAAAVGAVTPFIPWTALTLLAQLLELGVSPLAPGGPGFFVAAGMIALLVFAGMALGLAVQFWLAFGVYNAAERAFVRAYPWREDWGPTTSGLEDTYIPFTAEKPTC